jgi:hypothetical protein
MEYLSFRRTTASVVLPPDRCNEAALCEWLGGWISAGSDIDVPIVELPRMYTDLWPLRLAEPSALTEIESLPVKPRFPPADGISADEPRRGAARLQLSVLTESELR